ncbi:cytochrome P450 [Goodfellowiella coeruleoviolacea]|uniref:Cytochrome P450 n=1 Tax=Goodfellowiella coeruleoviolacea TaxID=334858 RepID=A0AAE3KIQ5_9PSEU|nr:cytochrome P450 [Goodfellowiella coeruleoviolacea]MCP2167644.1 Cytochrome P450 [Goodfellowiella coeruleoviolacea]
MSFGPIRRTGWRGMRQLHRRCLRQPVFRTLAGSVVLCDSHLARRALVDVDGQLDHVPAFWRPGGVALPPAVCGALNRWVHRTLAAEDPDALAAITVDQLGAARGDLHRACLHAVTEANSGPLGLDREAELRATVSEFLDTVFHSMLTGSRRRADHGAFQRLAARAGTTLATSAPPGFPELDPAVRGEVYLRAVTAFVGASSAALTWLLCALQSPDLVAARRAADPTATRTEAAPEHIALETLRLWPPAWQHRRVVLHDHRIGPLSVLRGDDVVVPAYALQRHPRYWPDADTFDPDRWSRLPSRPEAFLPFAVGPGSCVGAAFEVRWLAAVAKHLAAAAPIAMTRRGTAPCVTAVFSAPEHTLGAG